MKNCGVQQPDKTTDSFRQRLKHGIQQRKRVASGLLRATQFLLMSCSFGFALVSTATNDWLEEKASTHKVFTFQVNHGLWRICTETWFNKKIDFLHLRRLFSSQKSNQEDNDPKRECVVRFARDAPRTRILPLLDKAFEFYHEGLIAWEVAVLVMMAVSVLLNGVALALTFYLRSSFSFLIAAVTFLCAALSVASLIMYSMYHSTRKLTRLSLSLLSVFINHTYHYGYSYWLGVAACTCQFMSAFVTVILAAARVSNRTDIIC